MQFSTVKERLKGWWESLYQRGRASWPYIVSFLIHLFLILLFMGSGVGGKFEGPLKVEGFFLEEEPEGPEEEPKEEEQKGPEEEEAPVPPQAPPKPTPDLVPEPPPPPPLPKPEVPPPPPDLEPVPEEDPDAIPIPEEEPTDEQPEEERPEEEQPEEERPEEEEPEEERLEEEPLEEEVPESEPAPDAELPEEELTPEEQVLAHIKAHWKWPAGVKKSLLQYVTIICRITLTQGMDFVAIDEIDIKPPEDSEITQDMLVSLYESVEKTFHLASPLPNFPDVYEKSGNYYSLKMRMLFY